MPRREPYPVTSVARTPMAVVVRDLTQPLVASWETYVKPFVTDDDRRADRRWPWNRIYGIANAAGLPAYAICVDEMPVGFTVLVPRRAAVDTPHSGSIYTWFLTAAPPLALKVLLHDERHPERNQLGRILLHIAVVESFDRKWDGRTCLHADHRGGDRLIEFYTNQGMLRFPSAVSVKHTGLRNDGRLFYYDPPAAKQALERLPPHHDPSDHQEDPGG